MSHIHTAAAYDHVTQYCEPYIYIHTYSLAASREVHSHHFPPQRVKTLICLGIIRLGLIHCVNCVKVLFSDFFHIQVGIMTVEVMQSFICFFLIFR